jgi:hypothetical protein
MKLNNKTKAIPKLDVANLNKYFKSSGNFYFRKYNYDAHYFTKDTVNLQGARLPFKTVKGIPNDKKSSPLYSYYVYPKATSSITIKK